MKPVVPDPLVAQVAQRNSIAFVGAGLSAGLGMPGWPKLIRQMIDWCEAQGVSLPNKADIEILLNDKKDLLAAANALRSKMGDDKYREFLSGVFLRPELKPTEVHELLAGLPFVAAVTTNYDHLVEEGYRKAHPNESVSVFTHTDHEQLGTALNANRYFVLKAHGSVERPETMVLDSRDYRKLTFKSEGYRTFLRALFLHRTTLFLGFSMTDPELLFLLAELKEIFEGHVTTHYALMDVSNTTQTEQDQFEESYGVKIIPYTPSAPDHPEVKAFLIELDEKVTKLAVWHRLGEAQKVIKDDPHYNLVLTSDGEIQVYEKYPGAAEENPLTFTITIKGDEAIEAVRRLEATGEPLRIKNEHIVSATIPELLSRYTPVVPEEHELSTGVGRSNTKLIVKVTIECADGEKASLDNILLEDVQSGKERMILSNEKQDVPWKFRLVVVHGELERQFSYTFDDIGVPVKRALEGSLFSRALSKGGLLQLEDVETGERVGRVNLPPGLMPPPPPLLIRILEALVSIQKKTRVRFTSPEEVPEDMVKNIFDVQQIVEIGRVEFQSPYRIGATLEEAKQTLEVFSKEGVTGSFAQYPPEWVFNILGQPVSVGPVLVTCEKWHVTREDLEDLRKAVEHSPPDAVFELRMTPVDGAKVEARLPNWLPPEERERVYNHQQARRSILSQLMPILFETAQTTDGALDVEVFMALLNEAKGQKSEQGVPLNPLDTVTPEELMAVLVPLVAGRNPDERLKLSVRLYKEGWLPSGEAARIGGVDEATFMKELDENGGSGKARGAGSDT